MASPYWRQEEKWKAWGLLVLVVVLLLGQTGFAVLFNAQTGEFTSALASRDSERFWHAVRASLLLVAAAVPIYALYYLARDTLGNHWRRWLTVHFLDRYFRDRHFYELTANEALDNPDQRIAEDIGNFTQRALFFLLVMVGALLQLTAFSQVLWSISRELVYFLVVYALAGSWITVAVYGRPLMGLNFRQLRHEANLRFSLMRVREHAESIAFYRGEAREMQQVRQRYDAVFDNYRQLVHRQFFLNLFQYGYSLLTLVLPSAIIAGRVLSGELEVGRAVQAAGAFAAVLGAISILVDNFEGLSRFAAGIERLHDFSLILSKPPERRQHADQGLIESVPDTRLAVQALTLMTPHRERVLVRGLDLDIPDGDSLLIVGASGSGKSSVLRAIAGLWYAGQGRILRPAGAEILFLPQQPYMVQGDLRSQLLYPQAEHGVDDAILLELLARVQLPDLAERVGGLDAERDWPKLLSVGEQQRLAFARVLLQRPRYAILDEASSALDIANEEHLYRQLLASGITVVSVGHRPSLLKFHRHVLELIGDGQWRCQPAAGFTFDNSA